MSDTLTWPDGTVYTITRSSPEELEMEWRLPAGGWAPQPHVHPAITEEYEVLEGEFDVRMGRTWRRLRQGESAAVAPGIVHTFRVAAGPVRVRNVHRPANDFEPYIRALCRTANARRLGDLRGPRSLLYIALLVDRYPNHSRAAGRLLDAAAPRLASVARRLHLTTA